MTAPTGPQTNGAPVQAGGHGPLSSDEIISRPRVGGRMPRSPEDRMRLVASTFVHGADIRKIATRHGIAVTELMYWRRLAETAALHALKDGLPVVAGTEVAELRERVADLERELRRHRKASDMLISAIDHQAPAETREFDPASVSQLARSHLQARLASLRSSLLRRRVPATAVVE